jgi:hypothetical protein
MNAEIFAEWLRRQGYRVLRTRSSYWYESGRRAYQAFPYHWVIQPSDAELADFMRESRAIALRYSTPVDSPIGYISYHAVYDQPSYTIEGLDRRSRQNVRAGLANCHVEQIPIELLAEEGWELEMDTARRQGRWIPLSKEAWRRRYLVAADLPGFEAWGAIVDGHLAASLFTFQMEDCCEFISQQCHRDYLNARVNNALTFVVTQTMVNRPGIRSVFYTLQSLDAPASVDEFKFRMGYIAKPVRQRVFLQPWIEPFVNPITHSVLVHLLRLAPGNHFFAKAEGMFRFYLEGERPLHKQEWPECLSKYKDKLAEV